MSIFRNDAYDGATVSRYLDGELPVHEEDRFTAALETDAGLRNTVEQMRRVTGILGTDIDPGTVQAAQNRIAAALAETLRYRYRAPVPWWQRQISLPMPVMAAASVLFIIMAVGLIINPGILANRYYNVGDVAGNNPVNLQVQVSGAESDLLLNWLDEQNDVGSVTIQLPEDAQFQLRGEPVFLRPSAADTDEDDLEIVPLEVSTE
ncbi:MAG: hypothetical protein ACLFR8_07470 [Alkalispirochaeta sp.]